MENDSISSSSSESKLPLIVGIVGFALGAAGLVLGLKAKNAADAAQAAATESQKATAQVQADLQSKAPATELSAVVSEVGAIKTAMAADNAKIEKSINDLVQIINKKPTPPSNPNGPKTPTAGAGEYIVAKGDTLGGIARKVGISLKALQELNPTVNANKMQIGQKLKTK
ncbi:MAG: LysM domain [Verrucomicrobiota bacterium]|jgi:LysM repeat protein